MALSANDYTYAGGDQSFPVSFELGYIDRSDIYARVNDLIDGAALPVYADIEFIDSNNIRIINQTLSIGDKVQVRRIVSKTELQVDFVEGADVTPENLNNQSLQTMMVYQELIDGFVDASSAGDDAEVALNAAAESLASAAASAASAAESADSAEAAALSSASADAYAIAALAAQTVAQGTEAFVTQKATEIQSSAVSTADNRAAAIVAQSAAEAAADAAEVSATAAELAEASAELDADRAEAASAVFGGARVPLGAFADFPFATAPAGWLVRDGSEITTDHPQLRQLFLDAGSPYGSANGNPLLPDSRGRVTRGAHLGLVLGGNIGVGGYQNDTMRAHVHTANPPAFNTASGGAHSHSYLRRTLRINHTVSGGPSTITTGYTSNVATNTINTDSPHSHTIDIPEFDTKSTGGAETRGYGVGALPCIKAFDSFSIDGVSAVAVATQAQAEEGTDNNTMMTPLRVSQHLAENGTTPQLSSDNTVTDMKMLTQASYDAIAAPNTKTLYIIVG